MECFKFWIYLFVKVSSIFQYHCSITLDTIPNEAIADKPLTIRCTTNLQSVTFLMNSTSVCNLVAIGACTQNLCNSSYNYSCDSSPTGYTLTIPGNMIKDLHGTKLKCTSAFGADEEPEKMLFVKVPISSVEVSTNDENITVNNGEIKNITCKTSVGRPSSQIQWYISGSNITNNATAQPDTCDTKTCDENSIVESYSILSYKGDLNDDGKSLYCTAINVKGYNVTSKTKKLVIFYGPRQVDIRPMKLLYNVSETEGVGSISCTSECKPVCTVTWMGPNLSNGNFSELILEDIDRNQMGNYSCIASNIVGSMSSVPIYINVNYGPRQVNFVPSNETYTINETGSIDSITCLADCNPACVFKWDGPSIPENTTSELKLHNIDRNQTGNYTCSASNFLHNMESTRLSINVNYGPHQVDIHPAVQSYTVNETDSLGNITCIADCLPVCSMLWNGPNIPDDITSVLNLKNINRTQAGNYSCRASNGVGNGRSSGTINVVVNYEPVINDLSGNTTANENDTILIQCEYSSMPTPVITWKYNNGSFKDREIHIESNPSLHFSKLVITNMQCLDMGLYTCEANNIIGKDSKVFAVDVFCSPRVNSHQNASKSTTIAISDGDAINITSFIVAFPRPFIQWTFVSNESTWNISKGITNMESSRNTFLSNLFIANVSQADFGNYQIYAVNKIGSVIQSYNVISAQKPDKPENVTCYAKHGHVEIHWKPGFNGGDLQLFTVHYKPLTAKDFQVFKTIYNDSNREFMTAIITPLIQDTRYMFTVHAINKYNYSASNVVYCNTSRIGLTENQKTNLSAIGIGSGTGMAIIVVVIGVLIYWRMRRTDDKLGTEDTLLERKKAKNYSDAATNDDGLRDNILYESSGQSFKMTENVKRTVYAVVQKSESKMSFAKDGQNGMEMYDKVQKQRQIKSMINTSDKGHQRRRDDIYENVAENEDGESSTNVKYNKDGLIYADLEFSGSVNGRMFTIHGIDNKTDYADIDLHLKADPLPSDDSDEDKNTTK